MAILSSVDILLRTFFPKRCRPVNGTIASILRTRTLPQKPNTLSTSGFMSVIFLDLPIHLLEYDDSASFKLYAVSGQSERLVGSSRATQ